MGESQKAYKVSTGNSAEAGLVQLNKLSGWETCIENEIFTSADASDLFLVTKSHTEG